MSPKTIYHDFITGNPEFIKVYALLIPGGEYFWEISDYFGNIYYQPFTAGIDGYGYIDTSLLPKGFCNPFMHGFSVRIKKTPTDVDQETLLMLQGFDSVYVRLYQGNQTKPYVGVTIPEPILSVGTTKLIVVPVTEETDTIQDDRLIGAKVLLALIGGTEAEYDWQDTAVFNPATGTHKLGATLPGSDDEPIRVRYLIVK